MRSAIAIPCVMLATLSAHPASAAESASGSLRVSAKVPEVCTLATSVISLNVGAAVAEAEMFESCNTNKGYMILATHRPLEQDEHAQVVYDGSSSQLAPSGFSFVQFRQGARHRPVRVRLSTDRLQSPLAVSFAVTPV